LATITLHGSLFKSNFQTLLFFFFFFFFFFFPNRKKKTKTKRMSSSCSSSSSSVEDDIEEFDLIVIGGGSGGIACAKEALSLGAKVAVLDYVDESPQGTSWGLGGTCVNVGCIPKKLMHTASSYGEIMRDAREYGWKVTVGSGDGGVHEWSQMVELVQDYIGALNFSYVKSFKQDAGVTYLNAKGSFVDANTVHCFNPAKGRRGVDRRIRGKSIAVAVGGRPRFSAIEGARELCVTSDDVFSMTRSPGKTLVIGASYVALECGGFIHALGHDVTVLARSILLRGYDQQIAEKIGDYMKAIGVKILRPAVPLSMARNADGARVDVTYRVGGDEVVEDTFDTVLMAIGRDLVTPALRLDAAGVNVEPDGSLRANERQQTNVEHIYAIGDVLTGKPQLTPVAIQTGRLLARRLFGNGQQLMDFDLVATTVFTPLEYGAVGLSEGRAIEVCGGEDNLEVYHVNYQPLEWNPLQESERPGNSCYAKLVCLREAPQRVVGFHVLGLHAGEITQGFALALRLGATKADFDASVGIHPTSAEQFTTLSITKRSGQDPTAAGGCTT
jgi:thioredoxin reductase (NADPH)